MGKGIEEWTSVLHHGRENEEEGSDSLERVDASHMPVLPGYISNHGMAWRCIRWDKL